MKNKPISLFQFFFFLFFPPKFQRTWSIEWERGGVEEGFTNYTSDVLHDGHIIIKPTSNTQQYMLREYRAFPVVHFQTISTDNLLQTMNDYHLSAKNFSAKKLVQVQTK